jgi:hypothetical protein
MTQRRTLLKTGPAVWLEGLGLGLGAASLPGSAFAQAQAQATVPAEVASELPGAQWSGSARLRYFGFDIYDAALWTAPGFRATTYAQHALALELTYLRALSGRAIAQRSLDEMRRSGPITASQVARWLAAMQAAFPDVKAGDRLLGLHSPAQGARFWLNGEARGAVRDPDFSRLFFGIWLSESTSEPQLRSRLLSRAAT